MRAVASAAASPKVSSGRRRAIDSIAVLPLVNASGDAEAEYLSDGITETIISRLSRLSGPRVMSRSSFFRYLDDLRSDLRFADLVRRVGLAAS